MSGRPSVASLQEGVEAGDTSVLSRAITLAESLRADDQEAAQELLANLLPRTGKALRIGITGVPGAGKSTLIEALGLWLIEKGLKVSVLVVDPSSTRTGGSILGDKTRMQNLSTRENAYIRPSPTSGMLGGVARRTREAMLLCEAASFDVVLVESVGVGQSEAEMSELVDSLCLVMVPGTGDDLQGIKRGIMEMADLIVVNKADGERVNPAKRSRGDYRQALRMMPPSTPGWETPVLLASATEGTGLAEIWTSLERHRSLLEESGLLVKRRLLQQQKWLGSMLEESVLTAFHGLPGVKDAIAGAEKMVAEEKITVPQATENILKVAGLDQLVDSSP